MIRITVHGVGTEWGEANRYVRVCFPNTKGHFQCTGKQNRMFYFLRLRFWMKRMKKKSNLKINIEGFRFPWYNFGSFDLTFQFSLIDNIHHISMLIIHWLILSIDVRNRKRTTVETKKKKIIPSLGYIRSMQRWPSAILNWCERKMKSLKLPYAIYSGGYKFVSMLWHALRLPHNCQPDWLTHWWTAHNQHQVQFSRTYN